MPYLITSALDPYKPVQLRFYIKYGWDAAAFITTRKYWTKPCVVLIKNGTHNLIVKYGTIPYFCILYSVSFKQVLEEKCNIAIDKLAYTAYTS